MQNSQETVPVPFFHLEKKALIVHALVEYKLIPTFAEGQVIPDIYLKIAKYLLDSTETKSRDDLGYQKEILALLAQAVGIKTLVSQRNLYVTIGAFLKVPSKLMIPGKLFSLQNQVGFFIYKDPELRTQKFGFERAALIKQAKDIIKPDSDFFLAYECRGSTWCSTEKVLAKLVEKIVSEEISNNFYTLLLLSHILNRSEFSNKLRDNEILLELLPKDLAENYEYYKKFTLPREREKSISTPVYYLNPYIKLGEDKKNAIQSEQTRNKKCIIQ